MRTVAATIRTKLDMARPGSFFRTSDFAGPRSAVESHLSRHAAKARDLLRVRRGLYWKGVASRFGPGRPGIDDIVRRVTEGCGAGPSAWTASLALGISTQVPATATYAVVGPPPTGIPGAEFRSRRNLARVGLGYLEIALLEVLRDWPAFVEADWPALVARVGALRDAGTIRPARVAKAAAREHRPALRKRVDALLAGLPPSPSGEPAGRRT